MDTSRTHRFSLPSGRSLLRQRSLAASSTAASRPGSAGWSRSATPTRIHRWSGRRKSSTTMRPSRPASAPIPTRPTAIPRKSKSDMLAFHRTTPVSSPWAKWALIFTTIFPAARTRCGFQEAGRHRPRAVAAAGHPFAKARRTRGAEHPGPGEIRQAGRVSLLYRGQARQRVRDIATEGTSCRFPALSPSKKRMSFAQSSRPRRSLSCSARPIPPICRPNPTAARPTRRCPCVRVVEKIAARNKGDAPSSTC